jgi:hypothetical protein
MTRSISRDSFDEPKQYTGVHLQQGRVILDSDWNESQDILSTMIRRLGQDSLRDGVVTQGFEVQPVLPPAISGVSTALPHVTGGLSHLVRFGGTVLDDFESIDGWALSSPQGNRRIVGDRPYAGRGFLRLSGHAGTVTLTKTLASPIDRSSSQFACFRFRMNQTVLDEAALQLFQFFIEDQAGNRSVWRIAGAHSAKDVWTPGFVLPLDLRFQIADLDLLSAFRTVSYSSAIASFGATTANVTWSWAPTPNVPNSGTPPGLNIAAISGQKAAMVSGTPSASGTFRFRVTATSGSTSVSRDFTLRVQDPPAIPVPVEADVNSTLTSVWAMLQTRASTPTGTPANPTSIKKYGFQVFQNANNPIVWDFDALELSSRPVVAQAASNNFVIGGPLQKQIVTAVQLYGSLLDAFTEGAVGEDPVGVTAARMHVAGLACTQTRDVMYSDQADPNDPALAPPASGVRKDLVYLDVWREPVTYVEDPEIREIALGGPDSATRVRLRHRVRVSQGGTLPTGDGIGQGSLATEGSYTGKVNRLYLVEIDNPGDIGGAATFRWSEDNASTIQRVIEPVAQGATKVKVEDASAFQPNDMVLLRKEFVDEEHRIVAIHGNVVTFNEATTAAFPLASRAKLQRWNAFRKTIPVDANDPSISAAIDLSDGVRVRFGGNAMRKGDLWNFRTRYLAGDTASGIDSAARIEQLDYRRPQGVVHHYAPLATLIRDAAAHEPDRIRIVRDRRRRSGSVVAASKDLGGLSSFTSTTPVAWGGVSLGTTSELSTFLCVWAGNTHTVTGTIPNRLLLEVRFYNDEMTNPSTQPSVGLVRTVTTTVLVDNAATRTRSAVIIADPSFDVDAPKEITSAHLFVSLVATGTSLTINGNLSVVELKNAAVTLTDFV